MNRLGKAIWAVLFILVVFAVSVPQYFYWEGLQGVPESRDPITQPEIPRRVSETYWKYLGGVGEPEISQKSPHSLIGELLVASVSADSRPFHEAEHMLLSEAAWSLLNRDRIFTDWHLSTGSAMIWISRNWTVDEAMSTVLSDAYFGNGWKGIDSAALGYFGVPLSSLSEIEIIYLLVIHDAPSRFDPWCNSEYHRNRFYYVSECMGNLYDYASVDILPVPVGACR